MFLTGLYTQWNAKLSMHDESPYIWVTLQMDLVGDLGLACLLMLSAMTVTLVETTPTVLITHTPKCFFSRRKHWHWLLPSINCLHWHIHIIQSLSGADLVAEWDAATIFSDGMSVRINCITSLTLYFLMSSTFRSNLTIWPNISHQAEFVSF